MLDDLSDLYQQVILDHSKRPRNFRVLPEANRTAQGYNPLCGDTITLYLEMAGDVINGAGFQGSGCAISKASASLLTDVVKGKTTSEIRSLFSQMHDLVTTGKCEGEPIGKLAVFAGVHKFPARVKCAILPWHAAMAAIDGKEKPISTE